MKIVPLQLKIKNFYGELQELKNNITLISIESNDKEIFKKEICNKIIELLGINDATDFVKNIRPIKDEFIMVKVEKK